MPKILIIADDLTGAADCAARFAERGIESAVFLAGRGKDRVKSAEFGDAEVLAIDADTRCLDARQSAASVARIVDAYRDTTDVLFKKIDSTLRGNVAAELAAVLHARREKASIRVSILLAPAFPECGRTTVNGRQLVHGEPAEHSDFWRREDIRPRTGIAAMLEEAGLSCALIELTRVRAGASSLPDAIRTAASEADVVICDAETETDLAAIAHAAIVLDGETVWAGSAGLARHLADASSWRTFTMKHSQALRARGPALFVVGSPAEASRQQATALAAAPDVSVFTVLPSELLGSETQENAKLISPHLHQGRDVLLRLNEDELYEQPQGRLLSQSLARMIALCVHHAGALLATGGETARAILDAWGIERLRLLGEVEPGLPYSVAQTKGREILILTKAGGFGTRDTLIRCREFLRNITRDSEARATLSIDKNKS